jgi:autotransporter passenger strand-loop-strand repeat protein
VVAGGTQIVLARGTASATTVTVGAEVVSGTTVSTVISSGGTEIIWSGGMASASIVSSGGVERVMSGGAMSSAIIAGGTLDIKSGGLAMSSTINFSGSAGGSLVLEDNKFRGKIAGFGLPDTIDLTTIAFGSTTSLTYAASNVSGGTLTVTDGANTIRLAMLGSYVAGNFNLSTDGHGGTLVSDPPVSSGAGFATPQH